MYTQNVIAARKLVIFLFLYLPSHAFSMDEMAQYELLEPSTHQFAIRYDVSATKPGSTLFFNIIRPGSEASNEKIFSRATGKELPFVLTNGKEAKEAGQADIDTADDTKFIKVILPHPVPEGGEFRLRILKTYRDPKSYLVEGDRIIFDRSLSVKRNVIFLPKGYELIGSTVPVIVTTEPDGRIKVSMLNDRNEDLALRLVGRKLKSSK